MAFGELYYRYGHLVLGLCIKYLKNKNEAEDMVMTIFTKLHEDLKRFEINYFKSWLYTYSKNHCLMFLRKQQQRLRQEISGEQETVFRIMENEAAWHPNIEDLDEQEKQLTQLEKAITLLNEPQRKCIDLFYFKRHSYIEIVGITGYTENEVKSYLQNGKRNLKLLIEKDHGHTSQ